MPLFIALAVTSAHHNSGAPHSAEEVIAAKVIGAERRHQSDTFFSYTTNKEGSAFMVAQDFVKWLVHHTENPVCVVVGLDKFSNTALGRVICLSGQHLRVLDLVSMSAGGALDLDMVIMIADTINHSVVHPKEGHMPPRQEANFIAGYLKDRFKSLLPVAIRLRLNKKRKKPLSKTRRARKLREERLRSEERRRWDEFA